MAAVSSSSPPHAPPMESSDEADPKMLEMAREQGRALNHAARFMMRNEADDGAETHAGDYLVGYAVEKAEGLYHANEGSLEWREPDRENCHIEVSVRDAGDGRFVPGLDVRVTMIDANGKEIGSHDHPFLWHPWIHHYGRNWEIPGDGSYGLRIHIEPPRFARHDRKNGRRFTEPVDVEFRDVRILTGQKKSTS